VGLGTCCNFRIDDIRGVGLFRVPAPVLPFSSLEGN